MKAARAALLGLIWLVGAPGARADPALDQMMQNMNGRPVAQPQYNDAFCAEAKINIDWVLEQDSGARSTFSNAVRGGLSNFDAVVFAEHHNPHAQATIRGCRYSSQYIAEALRATMPSTGGGAPSARGAAPGAPPYGPQLGDRVGGVTTRQITTNTNEIEIWAHNDNPFSVMVQLTPTRCQNVFFCHNSSNPVGPHGDNLIGTYTPQDESAPPVVDTSLVATRSSQ